MMTIDIPKGTTRAPHRPSGLADRFTRIDGVSVPDMLAAGRSLPSSWFHEQEIFAQEQQQIWRRSWVYVGPASKAKEPGDYFTCEVAGVPLLVVRGKDELLRAFVNICRHRQHAVAVGSGNRKILQCMYHGWTYKLDGSFNAAPRTRRDPDFDGTSLCLRNVHVQTLGDMLFLNLDADADNLADALGPVPDLARTRGLPIDEATFRARRTMAYPSNWKIAYGNNAECYHCPTCHPAFAREFRLGPDYYKVTQVGPQHYETDADLREGHPHQYQYFAWPSFFIFGSGQTFFDGGGEVDRPHFSAFTFLPTSPTETRIDVDLYHVNDVPGGQVTEWFDNVFAVLAEDVEICCRVQRAHESEATEPGTFVTSIDSEQLQMRWEELVYRRLTEDH
jgi:phenylpropionate dioxygenase-like ring-hydroxylating dioxygenase large terminal subunit